MQLILQRSELMTALKRCASAIASGTNTSGWMQGVLIDARGDGITLFTSNGYLRVAAIVPGQIAKSGWAMFPHRKLMTYVDALPEGRIELTLADKAGGLSRVRSLEAKRKFQIAASDPEGFPATLTEETPEPRYHVSAKILQQALDETLFMAQKDYIDAVLIEPGDEKKFRMVGIGRQGMSVANAWFTEVMSKEPLIVPKPLADAIRSLPSDDEEVRISATAQRAIIATRGTTISCDLLSSSFPPWKDIWVHRAKELRFKISSALVFDTVKAVSVASDTVEGDERFVQINISYADDTCTIATRKSANNEGEDDFTVLEPTPSPFYLGVEGAILMQSLRAFSGQDVKFLYERGDGVQQAFCLENEYLSILLLPLSDVKAKS